MSGAKVLYSVSGRVATVRLNSPETMNALDAELFGGLRDATDRARKSAEVRAVVLTGSGRAFCAGGDLKRFIKGFGSAAEARSYISEFGEWIKALAHFEKPIVSAVGGHAAGAGFCIALHTDMVIASSDAKFTMSFINVGLIPDLGGLYALPRTVGLMKAKELVMSGRPVGAAEALELGIATKITEPDRLYREAFAAAETLAEGPPAAFAAIKKLTAGSFDMTLDELLEEEAELQARCMMTEDHKNAVESFFKKEKPVFRGE